MAHVPERPAARRYLAVGFAVVLVAAFITMWLEEHPGLSQLVNLNLDSWVMSGEAKSDKGDKIFIVTITDEDYKEQFQSRSPLDQEKVQGLIHAISESGAKVIGVDLDTADWDLNRLPARPDKAPIVWARDAEGETLHNVRGGDGKGVHFGLPAYTPDEDGVIRRYEANYRVSKTGSVPAFASSLLDEWRGPDKEKGAEKEAKLINFAGGKSAFSHLSSKALSTAAANPAWLSENPLRNKIVLLGGSYRAAQDRHLTPVGYLDGVDILAHTIYSEMNEADVKEPRLLAFGLDLLVGMGLVLAAWLLRRPWQMIVVIGLCFTAVFYGSWVVFQHWNIFVSFVPVVAGVLLHEVIDLRIEYGEVVRELEEARSKGHVH